jgi:hypothetical protein
MQPDPFAELRAKWQVAAPALLRTDVTRVTRVTTGQKRTTARTYPAWMPSHRREQDA